MASLIIKSTEPCTKPKLWYFSKIDVDIDCLNGIEKFKNSSVSQWTRLLNNWFYFGMALPDFPEKIQTFGGTLFWLTLYYVFMSMYILKNHCSWIITNVQFLINVSHLNLFSLHSIFVWIKYVASCKKIRYIDHVDMMLPRRFETNRHCAYATLFLISVFGYSCVGDTNTIRDVLLILWKLIFNPFPSVHLSKKSHYIISI